MIVLVGALLWLDWWLGAGDAWVVRPDTQGWGPLESVPLAIVTLVLLGLSFRELAILARARGVELLPISGMLLAAALGTYPSWQRLLVQLSMLHERYCIFVTLLSAEIKLLFMGVVLAFAEQMIRHRTDDAMRRIGCTLLAGVYLGIGAMMILTIRLSYGVAMLALFLAAVKCADIGAYFTGSAIGRHKLIAWLSPAKSWEGLAGGLTAAAAAGVLAAWVLRIETISLWQTAVFGLVVGLAGQFGDLCESLLKRSAGAKDSGSAVPQFGGVLDILDSPLMAAPVAVILLDLMT